MARPSKLTTLQCEKARTMRKNYPKRWSVPKLAKHFGVSESSMYKVFDGTYVARQVPATIPSVQPLRPHGSTPSIFHRRPSNDDIANLGEIDELTLAAAQLIVARSKFARVVHNH
jgi:hypothetical protein